MCFFTFFREMDMINVNDVYEKAKSLKQWDVCQERTRVIITCEGVFKCFISRAYELCSGKYVISAHMLLSPNKFCTDNAKLQFWNFPNFEKDDILLDKIFEDLRDIELTNNLT